MNVKKILLPTLTLVALGGGMMVYSQPAKAAHVVDVRSTWTRQFWNLDNNKSLKTQWFTSRSLRVNKGYTLTGTTLLPVEYKGVVAEKTLYYNYRTW